MENQKVTTVYTLWIPELRAMNKTEGKVENNEK